MATARQTKAARKNVAKAQEAATSQRSIAHLPKETRSALGKQGAAVAQRKRTGGDSPKTKVELYEIAKQRTCRDGRRWAAPSSPGNSAKSNRDQNERGFPWRGFRTGRRAG